MLLTKQRHRQEIGRALLVKFQQASGNKLQNMCAQVKEAITKPRIVHSKKVDIEPFVYHEEKYQPRFFSCLKVLANTFKLHLS